MEFRDIMEQAARAFEGVGVLILLGGAIFSTWKAIGDWRAGRPVYPSVRRHFGRSLLLGLEVLVAADIITTVAVDPTLDTVVVLAVLVLVRTVLSFSLDAEIDGVAPWRRADFEKKYAQDPI